MLLELSIENYALVRSLRIEFEDGLSAITGESGAGKSLLLGALGQVLGDRADTARISPDKTASQITALFDLSNTPSAVALLEEQGLENPDAPHECLLHRRIDVNGRSRAHVNNSSVTLTLLRTLAAQLVDIHAQDQHHALRMPGVQQQLFDAFAASAEELQRTKDAWQGWRSLLDEADALRSRVETHKERMALLAYQVEELDRLGLEADEYHEVAGRHNRLSKIGDLRRRAGQAIDLLEQDDFGISSKLGELSNLLGHMDDSHEALASARDASALTLSELGDAANALHRYLDDLQDDPQEMKRLDDRLAAIIDLSRKHRVDPESLHAHHQRLSESLQSAVKEDAALGEVEQRIAAAEKDFRQAAGVLSEHRRAAKSAFEAALREHMVPLGLGEARIQVVIEEHLHERGLERVAFHFRAAESLPPLALEKVASGGERSRVALAVELLAAEHSQLPSLVLDEADVGISGRLSDEVGKLLSQLSRATQILMITHAPQVAARADVHYRVLKSADDSVQITKLNDESRLQEIARMLGGEHLKDSTRDYARKLLASAKSERHAVEV